MGWVGFAKTPLFWSIFLLFAVAFNFHVPDLGETYVSRNLSAWAVICLSLVILWWRPFKEGEIVWSPIWLAGLTLPAIGGLLVLALNILGDYQHLHLGHYFLPLILLAFGLFVLGLLQHSDDLPDSSLVIIAIFLAFLPQYVTYLAIENPLISILLPLSSIEISPLFTKESAGFGQYNLLGSFTATLLIIGAAAFVLNPMPLLRRAVLALLLMAIVLDWPFVASKTAILGLFLSMTALALHVYFCSAERQMFLRFALASGIILVTYFGVVGLTELIGIDEQLASRSFEANQFSFSTRFTMWVIGFWGFIEKPIFGHGLGSYLTLYMDHFGRYGVAEGLTYYKLVTIPHNLFIHILSESGLFGLVVIMGPFIWLGLHLFGQSDNRWLLAALLLPILLHTQVEYPYVASGAHYWLFGVALVLALSGGERHLSLRRTVLPNRQSARFAYAGLATYAFAGLTLTVVLTAGVRQSTLAFAYSNLLPLEKFIQNRADSPDLQHPILGKRLNAITNLQLIDKIFQEKRFDLLRPLALPYFERRVLKDFPTLPVWETGIRVYGVLGEDEKILAIIDEMALYVPEEAEKSRRQFELYKRLRANHPR